MGIFITTSPLAKALAARTPRWPENDATSTPERSPPAAVTNAASAASASAVGDVVLGATLGLADASAAPNPPPLFAWAAPPPPAVRLVPCSRVAPTCGRSAADGTSQLCTAVQASTAVAARSMVTD